MSIFSSDTALHYNKAATAKYDEATVLIENRRPVGGCYLMGYVVEMAMKSAIAEIQNPQYNGEDGRNALRKDFGHRLEDLRTGLKNSLLSYINSDLQELLDQIDTNSSHGLSYWKVSWRYLEGIEEIENDIDKFPVDFSNQVFSIFENLHMILSDIKARRAI